MAIPLRSPDLDCDPARAPDGARRVPVAQAPRRHANVLVRIAPDFAALAAEDPDHHLWRNGRRWWIAFTVHRGHRQERVRRSLGTADLHEARRRRDALLARFASEPGLVVSLRLAPVGRRSSCGDRGRRREAPSHA